MALRLPLPLGKAAPKALSAVPRRPRPHAVPPLAAFALPVARPQAAPVIVKAPATRAGVRPATASDRPQPSRAPDGPAVRVVTQGREPVPQTRGREESPACELACLRFTPPAPAHAADSAIRVMGGLRRLALRQGAPAMEPAAGPVRTPQKAESPTSPPAAAPVASARLLDLAGRLEAPRPRPAAAPHWPRLLEQLQGRVELLRAEGGGAAELALEPAGLGSLRLRLAHDAEGWRLEIRTAAEGVARELQGRAQDLHDQLAKAGIRLAELRLLSEEAPAAPRLPEPRAPEPQRPQGGEREGGGRGDDGDERPQGRRLRSAAAEDFASRLERVLHAEGGGRST